METGYTVMDVMTNNPVTTTEQTSVMDAAIIMTKKSVGSLLVMEEKELKGIITEKDIVEKITAKNKAPDKIQVKQIMSAYDELIVIEPEKDIYNAINIMKENEIRRLPVIKNDKLVGFLTLKDILKIEPTLFDIIVEKIRIREEERKLPMEEEDEMLEEDE